MHTGIWIVSLLLLASVPLWLDNLTCAMLCIVACFPLVLRWMYESNQQDLRQPITTTLGRHKLTITRGEALLADLWLEELESRELIEQWTKGRQTEDGGEALIEEAMTRATALAEAPTLTKEQQAAMAQMIGPKATKSN